MSDRKADASDDWDAAVDRTPTYCVEPDAMFIARVVEEFVRRYPNDGEMVKIGRALCVEYWTSILYWRDDGGFSVEQCCNGVINTLLGKTGGGRA